MTKTEWHNVSGIFFVEVDQAEPEGYVDVDGKPVPQRILDCILPAVPDSWDLGVINIHFESSGYEDPGQLYGPPEKCYPPEGSDERTVVAVSLDFFNPKRCIEDAMPQDLLMIFQDEYQEEIDKAEVEWEQCYD